MAWVYHQPNEEIHFPAVGHKAKLDRVYMPHNFELLLDRRALDAISDVGGTVVVTVYAPERVIRSTGH